MPRPSPNSPEPSSPEADPQRKVALKTSAQLSRWSRARALRSGRGLDRPKAPATTSAVSSSPLEGAGVVEATEDEVEEEEEVALDGKTIYMVSDGTGCTLEQAVNAALGQFDHCLVNRSCAVNTHLISGVDDVDRVLDIIKQAAKERALLLFTLADPSMAQPAKQACQLWGVPYVDILRPMTDAIARHLGVEPSGIPRGERKIPLTEAYFRRIEAIEFTIKQDDGAQPQNLNRADIVLVGVSRSGKTPLSIYLSQKGYKVANVPIVMGIELPKTLFEIDQKKIYGLSINPLALQSIRKARAKALEFSSDMRSTYSEMDHVRRELEFANKIYSLNPLWPVVEVTGKAIEETAAVLLRIFYDRKQKNLMSGISRRY